MNFLESFGKREAGVKRIEKISLDMGAVSRKGTRESHPENEDEYLLLPPSFCVVLDGMGGIRGGNVASRVAREFIEVAIREKANFSTLSSELQVAALEQIAIEANAAVCSQAEESPDINGLGTTLALVYVREDGEAFGVFAGDTRIYLLQNGLLKQISEDEIFRKNVLYNYLGVSDFVPQIRKFRVQDGSVILVLSDGAYEPLGDELIAKLASSNGDSKTKAENLVNISQEQARSKDTEIDDSTAAVMNISMK
jgi:serine/threonine protein phosphatase PrpC